MGTISVTLCVSVTKHPMRSNLKKEGFVLTHNLRLQSIMGGGEAWLQEQKAAGHKEQWMNAGPQLTCFFLFSPRARIGLPTPKCKLENPSWIRPEICLQVTLDDVRLPMDTNQS